MAVVCNVVMAYRLASSVTCLGGTWQAWNHTGGGATTLVFEQKKADGATEKSLTFYVDEFVMVAL